jgi:hypothetical protein
MVVNSYRWKLVSEDTNLGLGAVVIKVYYEQ